MVKSPLGEIMLLRENLEEIDDFRKRCRKFELADIFLLVLFGLLSGIKDIEHIAEWAEEAEESIKALVKFEFGPPSADTILRVFRNVNSDKIEKVFLKWAHGIYKKVKIEPDRTIVAMAREERTVNGKTSTDIRFFLTSLDNIELVKKSIRLHWGIENRLHWCLDMTFNEDYKRHRKDHSPENMTVMRRLALNILRQAEKPENKKQDSLSKRMIWFRENRQFRQTVLRLL